MTELEVTNGKKTLYMGIQNRSSKIGQGTKPGNETSRTGYGHPRKRMAQDYRSTLRYPQEFNHWRIQV